MYKGHRTLIKFYCYISWICLEILPYTHDVGGFVFMQPLCFQDDLKLAAKKQYRPGMCLKPQNSDHSFLLELHTLDLLRNFASYTI